jgi:type VI secretion system secreted protein Hcp
MAGDLFIKLGDIKGESKADGHVGEIEIMSWSWGATQSGSTRGISGSTAGKVNVQDLTFTKLVCTSTPNILNAVCVGSAFPLALLTCEKSAGNGKKPVQYLKIKLASAMVSSYSCGGSGGSDTHVETVTINFSAVETTYTPMNPDGTPGAAKPVAYNVVTGKPTFT